MCLTDLVDDFIGRLKDNPQLADATIIKAYPFAKKPTMLDGVVIAVSPARIEGDSTSIGEDRFYASYTIDADIFVPQQLGSPEMWRYIQQVLKSQVESMPSSIATSPVEKIDKISCYTAKCSVTYNGELQL